MSIAEARVVDPVGGPADRVEPTRDLPISLELCRVSVLSPRCQLDLALPVDLPVAALIPGVVDMVRDHDQERESSDRRDAPALGVWTLAPVGRPPLRATATLGENGVLDGDTLILGISEKPAPTPLFDDVMHTVATDDAEHQVLWTRVSARVLALGLTVALILFGSIELVRTTLFVPRHGTSAVEAAVALGAAILLVVTGAIVCHLYFDRITAYVLAVCSLPLAFSAGLLFVPGRIGSPHLILACALTGAICVASVRLTGIGYGLFTGTSIVMICGSIAAAVAIFTDLSHAVIGGTASAGSLIGMSVAPRISMMQARLPLPAVPVAGATFDGFSGNPEAEEANFANLALSAARARAYLTGCVSAMALVALIGGITASFGNSGPDIYWPGTLLATAIGIVVLLRGRTFAMVVHAAPLLVGGSVLLFAVLIGTAQSAGLAPLPQFAIVVALVVCSLLFGVIVPTRSFSPIVRRTAELGEYALIASIIPLVCWNAGLYDAIRGL